MKPVHSFSWSSWPLSTWLCGGALVASLAWNVKPLASAGPPSAPCETARPALDCEIDFATLGVSDEQGRLLEDLCSADCGRADELAARADAQQAELERLLASPGLEPAAARALAREVGELRARSVEACVEAVLRVREVLTPAQTAGLLDSCRKACRK